MPCGIYKITNKLTNESYVGQSVDIYRRWDQHRRMAYARNKKQVTYPLYRDMRYYGIENFDFEILEECDKSKLDEREEYWINFYGTIKQYNQIMPKEKPSDAKKRRRQHD